MSTWRNTNIWLLQANRFCYLLSSAIVKCARTSQNCAISIGMVRVNPPAWMAMWHGSEMVLPTHQGISLRWTTWLCVAKCQIQWRIPWPWTVQVSASLVLRWCLWILSDKGLPAKPSLPSNVSITSINHSQRSTLMTKQPILTGMRHPTDMYILRET